MTITHKKKARTSAVIVSVNILRIIMETQKCLGRFFPNKKKQGRQLIDNNNLTNQFNLHIFNRPL